MANQVVAVNNRVVSSIPLANPQYITRMRAVALKLARRMPRSEPQELGEFALEYSGAKRDKYLNAAKEVRAFGLSKSDYYVTMFVKPDRLDPTIKTNPDPRPIQFRHPRYCVLLAQYIKAIEPSLYALHYQTKFTSSTRMIAKGLNQFQRASLLRSKWNRFHCPRSASIDGERFDKHMNTELLKVEHYLYSMLLPSKEFATLLKAQLLNRGFSKDGVKYVANGRRMSGEMNTALGNCAIMIMMVLTVMLPLRIPFEIMDDGDDCLIIYESPTHSLVVGAIASMTEFGLKVKLENIADSLENVKFCQSQPVLTAKGWKFCRNPFRVMSNSMVGLKWLTLNTRSRQKHLNGIAECELVLNKGVPVLHAFAAALRRNANISTYTVDHESGEYLKYMRELKAFAKVDEVVPITEEARLSFSRAFGVTPEQQVEYELRLDAWQFPIIGDTLEVEYMDARTWVDNRQYRHSQAAAYGENDPK